MCTCVVSATMFDCGFFVCYALWYVYVCSYLYGVRPGVTRVDSSSYVRRGWLWRVWSTRRCATILGKVKFAIGLTGFFALHYVRSLSKSASGWIVNILLAISGYTSGRIRDRTVNASQTTGTGAQWSSIVIHTGDTMLVSSSKTVDTKDTVVIRSRSH